MAAGAVARGAGLPLAKLAFPFGEKTYWFVFSNQFFSCSIAHVESTVSLCYLSILILFLSAENNLIYFQEASVVLSFRESFPFLFFKKRKAVLHS